MQKKKNIACEETGSRNNMMYASFAKKMESRDPICTNYNPIQSIVAFV
jgi:hypothetical protein